MMGILWDRNIRARKNKELVNRNVLWLLVYELYHRYRIYFKDMDLFYDWLSFCCEILFEFATSVKVVTCLFLWMLLYWRINYHAYIIELCTAFTSCTGSRGMEAPSYLTYHINTTCPTLLSWCIMSKYFSSAILKYSTWERFFSISNFHH